ncbi:MAG: hypothetical protein NVSMB3_08580 [Acidobacteriaceae bacterium]
MGKSVVLFLCLLTIAGCGGGSSASPPDFSLAVLPGSVSLTNGGAAQEITVTAFSQGSFSAPVQLSLAGLPAGVVASPTTLTIVPGQLQQIQLTANGVVTPWTGSLTLQGSANSVSHTAGVNLTVVASPAANTTASISGTSYSFGNDLVGTAISRSVVTVRNTGTAELALSPTVSGDAEFSIVAAQSCGATLAAGATCKVTMSYAPNTASQPKSQVAVLDLGFSDVPTGTPHTVTVSGVSAVLTPGTVTPTNNPQVALYSLTLPFPGTMTVSFGTDTSYGRKTWTQTADVAGTTIRTYVAGMLGSSTYHMQATVLFHGGLSTTDTDHTFTTGKPLVQPSLSVTTTQGMTPQPGVEVLNGITGAATGLSVTDLQGNVIWSYALPAPAPGVSIEGAKLLPNGKFLMSFGDSIAESLHLPPPPGGVNEAIREIDLAGNIVREISLLDLNAELTVSGYNLHLTTLHHDVTPLPNGHWLVLGGYPKSFTDLPGYPGTTQVVGDVIVDLDTNLQPVWVWNEFDHFDVNRHPLSFPDWTHTNAVVYSKDDGNLLVSIRHQNWVVKVDYKDGQGSGDVLWRLGQGGDFTLKGGTDPTDWMYAQHFPSFVSANTSGVFSLILMDNGNDRSFPAGVVCGTADVPCFYSSVPIFQIDESAKTATLLFHQILRPELFNSFGGSAGVLGNGDVEYDLCGVGADSDIFEVTQSATPATVWHMHSSSGNIYRGSRMPSLYPGVQW